MIRTALLSMIMLILIAPINTKAVIWDDLTYPYGFFVSGTTVKSYTKYLSIRDEYRTDFAYPPKSTWEYMRVYFEYYELYPVVKRYDKVFHKSYVNSKIMYLTCNGVYQLQFLDIHGDPVAWTDLIPTSEIITPTCDSYPDGGSKDDLNAGYSINPSGGYDLHWTAPGSGYTEIWLDGNLIDQLPPGSGSYHIDRSGMINIVVRDNNGNIIGWSDLQVPDYTGQPDYGSGSQLTCDICGKLQSLLQCPGWDEIMGDLTSAIRDALPPPPDWDDIAKKIVGHLSDYLGDVPEPPTKDDLKHIIPDMPDIEDIDIDIPDLTPVVAPGYDVPLDFDITDTPLIPVEDESEPIDIYDPYRFIDSDPPGVMVYPGDPRNHSGGIKSPEIIPSDYPMPVPTLPPSQGTPVDDVPLPTTPLPPYQDIPIPKIIVYPVTRGG